MQTLTREEVTNELIELLKQAREDWDSSIVVTEKTGMFNDLGFESIDAVGLSSALEAHFNQTLPFAEFMTQLKTENVEDITVGRLVQFLMQNLNLSAEKVTA